MNRLKKKAKKGVLFLTAAAVIFSVSGFGMGTVYAGLAAFDIDGNGVVDGGTDGLLINRYMYGIRGDALTDTAVGQNCTRCTASAIEEYLAKKTASSSDEDIFTNGLGMTFSLIPAGTFTMGSPGDEPGRGSDETQHEVTLTQSFYIQTTEVTQGQWKAVMGTNPSSFSECGDNCPVETVSWDDVQGFITKMNERGEGTYRLPTEAEWEYAARAGTSTPFHFGQCLSTDQANYHGDYPMEGCPNGVYRSATVPVASFEPNAHGLYDMHGNVWEWCADRYGDSPTGSVTDPTGPDTGSNRVLRGGSWINSAGYCRSAYRRSNSPGYRDNYLGLRLALSPGQQRDKAKAGK